MIHNLRNIIVFRYDIIRLGGEWKCHPKGKHEFPRLMQTQTHSLKNLEVKGGKFSVLGLWVIFTFSIEVFLFFLIFDNKYGV